MLPKIERDRYYVNKPFLHAGSPNAVYLTGSDPCDVWSAFEKAEANVLSVLREAFSQRQNMGYGLSILIVYPDLNKKFKVHYYASATTTKTQIVLTVKRSPGMEVGENGHETGNYLVDTKEIVWTEKLKKNTTL